MMYIAKKLLDPKNDYVFKRIFGYVGNEDITKGLLSAILEDVTIESLTLDCKEILEQDLKNDKFGILDIRAIIDNSVQCNIEMQMIDRKDIENRILFYWSKLYSKSIKIGEGYNKAQRTIIILFSNYELSSLEKVEKYFTKWHICEDKYKDIILTKNLEIYIIELPKYKKYAKEKTKLSTWVKFIESPEVIDMSDIENNEALEKAKKVLNEISDDEKEEYLAEQRLMYIMDQKAIEAAGFDKGERHGIKETAKKLLKEKVEISIIMKCTGLTEEEINKLV